MNERLLQFIWQFQYFNTAKLLTIQGEEVTILNPGVYNVNQGPDFLNARIKIGATHWAGNIELHVKTSDYLLHKHQLDKNYHHLILHVVYHNDTDLLHQIPTLELQPRISSVLLDRYATLLHNAPFVSCQSFLPAMSDLQWTAWKDRLVAERLQQKTDYIRKVLDNVNGHWEQCFWQLLSRNFGYKVNADLFELMASSIDLNIIAKHKHSIVQLEALLMGQANMLSECFGDDYAQMLLREHRFLKNKYRLAQLNANPNFLRMRPANFPTIRLSQLAALLYKSNHLLSIIKEENSIDTLKKLFEVSANDYWSYHYKFDEATPYKEKLLGEEMIFNLFINTVIPVLFALGQSFGIEAYKTKALRWLEELPSENNNVIRAWKSFSVATKSALDSQALLQLKSAYCASRHCLNCAVGNHILREPEAISYNELPV